MQHSEISADLLEVMEFEFSLLARDLLAPDHIRYQTRPSRSPVIPRQSPTIKSSCCTDPFLVLINHPHINCTWAPRLGGELWGCFSKDQSDVSRRPRARAQCRRVCPTSTSRRPRARRWSRTIFRQRKGYDAQLCPSTWSVVRGLVLSVHRE